ncbi:MAG TPA: PqqD family protein [Solirubrobacteraceae bacterium]
MSEELPEPADALDIHEVEDGLVVYDLTSERVHYLNETASFVFVMCTGKHDAARIAELLQGAWELPELPAAEVAACLEQLRDEGLIR